MITLFISISLAFILYLLIPLLTVLKEISRNNVLKEAVALCEKGDLKHYRGFRFSNPDNKGVWLQAKGNPALVFLEQARFFRLDTDSDDLGCKVRPLNQEEFLELSEGIPIDVIGIAGKEGGVLTLSGTQEMPVNLIINSDENPQWQESLDNGSKRGSYFNSPWLNRSIIGGAISSIFFLSLSISGGNPPGFIIVNLILAVVPLFPVIPPGLLFFMGSILCWRRKKTIPAVIMFLLTLAVNSFVLFKLLVWLFTG